MVEGGGMTCFIVYKDSIYCTSGDFEDSEDCDPQPFPRLRNAELQLWRLEADGFKFNQAPRLLEAENLLHGFAWSPQIERYRKPTVQELVREAIANGRQNGIKFQFLSTKEICEDMVAYCSGLENYKPSDLAPHVNRALGRNARGAS